MQNLYVYPDLGGIDASESHSDRLILELCTRARAL